MPFNSQQLRAFRLERQQQWDSCDTITYALATGYAQDGVTAENLCYVYERNQVVVASFATVLARNAAPSVADFGADYSKSVLASIHVNYHAPLPVSGNLVATTTITGLLDKGLERGALVGLKTKLRINNLSYATVTTSLMARADGGCGSFGDIPINASPPQQKADQSKQLTTRPDQAALYRLLGDVNPLHIDPRAAATSGFSQPIMHGLCTFGIASRGLSEIFKRPFSAVSARFSAPVFPGETLRIDTWNSVNGSHFEVYSEDRNVRVLASGFVAFSDDHQGD